MEGNWYSCIESDMNRVEAMMTNIIRSDNPELNEMCTYVLSVQGKRIRPSVCMLSYYACGGNDSDRVINISAALEIIHNATLVHDDINDEAELRRGRKPLYKEYSLSKSIVAGDFLLAAGFRLVGSLSREVIDYIAEAASSMGAGEFNQQDFEHNISVSESDYFKIIDGKTAKFIECAAKCGAYFGNATLEVVETIGEFANRIGLAFQIIDDILDVIGDKNTTGKPVGNDIFEGKPTLPTIYGMQDAKYGPRIREVFENERSTQFEVSDAIECIKKTDSIPRCFSKARSIVDEAMPFISCLEESQYKQSLKDLAYYIVNRDR